MASFSPHLLRLACLCALAATLLLPSAAARPVWSAERGYLHHHRGSGLRAAMYPQTFHSTVAFPDSWSLSSPSPGHSFHALQVIPDTVSALEDLFIATGGPAGSWVNSTGWMTSTPACQWFGVTCNAAGNVAQIALVNNGLSGQLTFALSSLYELTQLDLSLNPGLTGTLPPQWMALNLTAINFRGASLSGYVPPSVVCSWSSLQYLDLSNNQLLGPLPSCLGSLPQLLQLSLGENALTGPIPSSYAGLSSLQLFDVAHNQLTGDLEPITGLPNLAAIFVHHNQFSGQNGALPLDLLNSKGLIMLDLSHNLFTSVTCASFEAASATSHNPALVDLILANNSISDSLSDLIPCLATVAPNANWIDLSHNLLTWGGDNLKFLSSYFPYIYKGTPSTNLDC